MSDETQILAKDSKGRLHTHDESIIFGGMSLRGFIVIVFALTFCGCVVAQIPMDDFFKGTASGIVGAYVGNKVSNSRKEVPPTTK